MVFDPCPHQITQIILKAGAVIRQLKGLSEEKNITLLYNETAPLLGMPPTQMNTGTHGNHYPSIAASAASLGKDAKFIIPSKPCPKCGKMTFLLPICQSCKDAEGGKYKSGYKCDENMGGCGFINEKTEEWWSQRLSKMGVEIPNGTKESIGVKTITDEGLK